MSFQYKNLSMHLCVLVFICKKIQKKLANRYIQLSLNLFPLFFKTYTHGTRFFHISHLVEPATAHTQRRFTDFLCSAVLYFLCLPPHIRGHMDVLHNVHLSLFDITLDIYKLSGKSSRNGMYLAKYSLILSCPFSWSLA